MLISLRSLVLTLLLSSALAGGCALNRPAGLTEIGEGIIQVSSSSLMWQKSRSPLFSSITEAEIYVKDLRLGGYDDWRLPTAEDFLDLYFTFDYGNAQATEHGINIGGNYWSVDEDGNSFIGAWQDDSELCEISRTYRPGSRGYVRAVRP